MQFQRTQLILIQQMEALKQKIPIDAAAKGPSNSTKRELN